LIEGHRGINFKLRVWGSRVQVLGVQRLGFQGLRVLGFDFGEQGFKDLEI